jgi:hypothetical protein
VFKLNKSFTRCEGKSNAHLSYFFRDGREERAAASDGGFDDMREESSEDEDPAPFEDYALDNAGYPKDEEVVTIVSLVELMCRAVYTPLRASVSRICERNCSGPTFCQRRVPVPHGQIRLSWRTRASPGPYNCLTAVHTGGPPYGLAGSCLTSEAARRQEDRGARLRRDAANQQEDTPMLPALRRPRRRSASSATALRRPRRRSASSATRPTIL